MPPVVLHERTRTAETGLVRLRMRVSGAVQGVGFRPYVFRLAQELVLTGFVENTPDGVLIEVEGPEAKVADFVGRLPAECPAVARIAELRTEHLPPQREPAFTIRDGKSKGRPSALVLPDLAMCAACRADIENPASRHYRYPFTNCTHCGPRYSILHRIPYDRPNTAMAGFAMCPQCRAEYEDPANRRFHAQPVACPHCGPQLALWGAGGEWLAEKDDALRAAAAALRRGQIVAVKGLGGFHLLVDARKEALVEALRARKYRDAKPFAVMFPSLAAIEAACSVSPLEHHLLTAPEAPIVLLAHKADWPDIAANAAPGLDTLGAFLPYTPLHYLLMQDLQFPVAATSGNRTDEPICTDEQEALERLDGIADLFLVHDRPIVRAVDDSVVRVMAGHTMILRRARGYAPLPLVVNDAGPPTLAVGGHLKNTVAHSRGREVFLSQHIGDLDTPQAVDAFRRTTGDVERLFDTRPVQVVCDAHPDYASTHHAATLGLPVYTVQHHYAHVLACMAEHGLAGPVLGVSWDGTGYGADATVWGGEFLQATYDGYRRVGALRPFRLPGGAQAVREPRRSALGVLHALGRGAVRNTVPTMNAAFTEAEWNTLGILLERGVNAPVTTSAGRLFDAAASLAGLCHIASYEGQAAMLLEAAAAHGPSHGVPGFPFPVRAKFGGLLELDWEPLIEAFVEGVESGVPAGRLAAAFQTALVEGIRKAAWHLMVGTVVLTGGCFQNRWLLEHAIAALQDDGFAVYWPQQAPPNDGGLALGQAVYGMRRGAAGHGREE